MRKRLQPYNLKKHKCKLNQETGCLIKSKETLLNDVTTKQPTEKTLINMFPAKTPRLDALPKMISLLMNHQLNKENISNAL